ncbi:MAG TPA: hypothetical protein PKM63_15515 [Panacibacter sp.]|nr:hypothetical protein [Panacibacter sp.]HNP45699.1 hypothetical protein [Panacibacter sp.]
MCGHFWVAGHGIYLKTKDKKENKSHAIKSVPAATGANAKVFIAGFFAAKSGGVQECDASMPNSGTVDGPITAILHGFVISKIKKLIATCFAYFALQAYQHLTSETALKPLTAIYYGFANYYYVADCAVVGIRIH